ncbi:quinone oxidoreductase family protein [Phaeodactylibacter luteus]|uniref:Zinc-binding dehydrogenase n=1 Tax=Phaeodactylibacter luteus TaxID=1564516 RepID=A0A5C6RY50_9BACT|nr:zinc-binding dehydrogenase [Phaeodactylibacter luteus]TXB66570.1 zinc-binding dehydrogenase [Phaeodactylibacter luteus]
MKAYVLEKKGQPPRWSDFELPAPKAGEHTVNIKAAALNHRDVFITQGLYPGIKAPSILGADGAGLAGQREVVINPNVGWGSSLAHQEPSYRVLGMPDHGTMSEQIILPEDRLEDKPAHLSWEEAAALPLGGLTAYRALFTRGGCAAGQKVLISGIGGGVALFALQFALACGAEAYVTSGSPEKLEKARAMGAVGGASYKEDDWHKKLAGMAGGFDLIIDSAGGPGFAFFPKIANFGARIVTYGGTRGKVPDFSPQMIFWKQITIHGTSMGSDQEFRDMLAFVGKHQIRPVIDRVYPMHRANEAFQRMAEGAQFGKIVLSL